MANFIYSFGYPLEPSHTGMLVYLCDLWNEGNRAPLNAFLGDLDISLGELRRLRAVREHKNIDLVVFDADNDSPVLTVEMKVDSHEGWVKGEHQTIAYQRHLPAGTPFLYVTLGVGEYFRAPYSEQARWVRIREFHGALKAVADGDPLIDDWREAVGNEIDLQDRCFRGDTSRIEEYRDKTWSLYFLGHLKEKLIDSLSGRNTSIAPAVYAYGSAPDTILNFGMSKNPDYMEINNNAHLNLKINIEEQTTLEEKEEYIEKARNHYQDLLKEFEPTQNLTRPRPTAKSHTVMRFDIDLLRIQNGNLSYKSTEADTIDKLTEVLDKFFT